MKKIKYIYLAFLLVLAQVSKAQYVLNQADKQFELYQYAKAKILYEQAFKKKQTLYTAKQLAITSEKNKEYKETEKWYAKALTFPGAETALMLAYAKALQSNSKYVEAKAAYQQYIQMAGNVPKADQDLWLKSCDSAQLWMASPKKMNIENIAAVNTGFTEYGAIKYKEGVVFVSDRTLPDNGQKGKKGILRIDKGNYPDRNYYSWTGENYLKLLYANKNDEIATFSIGAENNYHIGTPTFSKDGKEAFFTITRVAKDLAFDKTKLRIGTVKLEIYHTYLQDDGTWGKPVAFPYNNINDYSVGDPFLSEDGKTLYFVSDMQGGTGGLDIYKTIRNNDGSWSKPENMQALNTPGDERTPYFLSENVLYFSTNGRIGMGDLDIYKAVNQNGIWHVQNLGYPYNSPQDDFAFSIEKLAKGWSGYLSSNRMNGKGSDDIYKFSEDIVPPIPKNIYVQGTIYDQRTNKPLANAQVTMKGANGSNENMITDGTGGYKFPLQVNNNYHLKAQKTLFNEKDTSFAATDQNVYKDFYLGMISAGKSFEIRYIYYDFDKDKIRPDAALELNKLAVILKEYPEVKVELGSHTDSRGPDIYNLDLSQRRARSAVNYILSKGINKERITAKGYGETQLVNRCVNGAKCSAQEHQLNRRTEIKIVE